VEKADLSKGYQNPKRKLGVIAHFSEIIELSNLGKKMSYTLCVLKLLRIMVISEKCGVTHIFLFRFQ